MGKELIPSFSDWTERLKVYNDFIKALAEYKKASAEALLKEAEAAQQFEKARAMQLIVNQLAKDLKGLNTLTNQLMREQKRIEDRVKNIQHLLRGRRIDTFQVAWQSYAPFESQAMIEAKQSLFSVLVPATARSADNFLDNRNPKSQTETFPDNQSRALQLAAWLKEKRYMTRSGSDAQLVLVELFAAINDVAAQTVADLQQRMDDMRTGTYDAWQPVSILGVPATAAAARIEKQANPQS